MKLPDARVIAGGGIYILSCAIFVMIYLKPEIAKDDLFKMLSQAVVTQGLIGLAMAYLFTSQHHQTPPAPDDIADAAQDVARAAEDRAKVIGEGA